MTLRYGVFNLGQIWTVVCDDGVKLGFPSRENAVKAAADMVDMHRAYGADAELLVQDELGALRRVPPAVKRGAGGEELSR